MNNSNTSSLLDEYKKYDYLNQDSKNPLIKILVSYIKPSFLFKTKILTPIHLGRAVEEDISKDGKITKEDLDWLHENCIGDDDFEGNISSTNRRVGFLTGTYWAWKNYEKLGNPEYFGSFGYRRLFSPTFLSKLQNNNFDAIVPYVEFVSERSLKEQLSFSHGNKLYKIMEDCLKRIYPDDYNIFIDYFNQRKGFFREIYIFKKETFFNFCSWIFPLLFDLLSLPDELFKLSEEALKFHVKYRKESEEMFKLYSLRNIAFIIERLTGLYIYKLTKDKTKNICYSICICTKENSNPIGLDNEILRLGNNIRNLQTKYILKNIDYNKQYEPISIVSVVNNYDMYNKYITNNLYLKNLKNISFVDLNNCNENVFIPKRYNSFLEKYNYNNPSWFIFAHSDWEIADNINEILKNLDKDNIYGPIGTELIRYKDGVFRDTKGKIYECTRDGKKIKTMLRNGLSNNNVSTLDCTCIIVHSSLVKKYNFRFDEMLQWDLYVEDFCIQAQKAGVNILALEMENYHHSNTCFIGLPVSYYMALEYLNKKYPNELYAGNCSYIGGADYIQISNKDYLFYKVKQQMQNSEEQNILTGKI